jgi:hypothetical protein
VFWRQNILIPDSDEINWPTCSVDRSQADLAVIRTSEILVRHPAGEINFSLLQSVQTGSRALPASSTFVRASIQLRQSGRSVKLTTHEIESRSIECEWLYLHAPVCLHGVYTSHFTFASVLKTTARLLKRKTMDYGTKKYWTVNFFFGLRFQFTDNTI